MPMYTATLFALIMASPWAKDLLLVLSYAAVLS